VTEPDEVGWRVRAGASLLIHTPMSDERREAFRREEERERKAAEFEAEQRPGGCSGAALGTGAAACRAAYARRRVRAAGFR
jgi:hypothetical protein